MNTRPRVLRKTASDAENRLWWVLRNRGLAGHKFVRQMPVGPFIADFVCRRAALIIEIDGGQHADSESDQRRTTFLNTEGYSVLRFWNNEVMAERDAVLDAIVRVMEGSPSPDLHFTPATLSPAGRGQTGRRASAATHTN
jgi:very-short-patch-repair endonuclease